MILRLQSAVSLGQDVRAWVPPSRGRCAVRTSPAFTLLELLVVIGIIALLAAIALPVMGMVQRKAAMVRELHAGRQLMIAYTNYSAANDGQLLKGYDHATGDITLPNGQTVSGILCARYPWRLAPYVGGQLDDVFLVNDARRKVADLPTDSANYHYLASLTPSFGINAYCIGGYKDASNSSYFTTDLVTRQTGAANPSALIVFASARSVETPGQPETPGFHLVIPPKLWRNKWTIPFDRKKQPSDYGNVDPRWDGKALCAFLDGHVALLSQEELQDMRHWSNQAVENDDPNFVVPR